LECGTSERRDIVAVIGSSRVEWGFSAHAEQRSRAKVPAAIVHNFASRSGPLQNWATFHRIVNLSAAAHGIDPRFQPPVLHVEGNGPYETKRLSQEKLTAEERRGLRTPRLEVRPECRGCHGRGGPSSRSGFAPGRLLDQIRPNSFVARDTAPRVEVFDAWGDLHGRPHLRRCDSGKEHPLMSTRTAVALTPLEFEPTAVCRARRHPRHVPSARNRRGSLIMPEADEYRGLYSAKTHAAIRRVLGAHACSRRRRFLRYPRLVSGRENALRWQPSLPHAPTP